MASAPLPSPKLATLVLLCGLSVLPLNILLPSLPAIGRDLHASYGLVSISLAGYAVIAASLEMVMGMLSDRFGRRTIVLVCLTTFAIGSVGCALSGNIWLFLDAVMGWRLKSSHVGWLSLRMMVLETRSERSASAS